MVRLTRCVLALALLTGPVRAGGDDLAAGIARAEALCEAADFDAAEELLDALLAARPDDPRLLLAMGRAVLGKAEAVLAGDETFGRLKLLDALAWIERAADAGPGNAEAARLLGDVAVRAGESRKAADAYRRAAGLRPEDGEVRFLLAGALADLGKHREALAALAEAAGILGPDPRVLLRRGECHAALGDAEEAEAALLTLVRGEADAARPGSEPARRGLVALWRLHAGPGRYDHAERVFRGLVESHPGLAGGRWYLAHALLLGGNPGAAAEAFATFTEANSTAAGAWQMLGTALVRAGRAGEAHAAFERAARLDPDGPGTQALLEELAAAISAGTDPLAAMAAIDSLLGLRPDDTLLLERRADLLCRAGRPAEAIRAYRRLAGTLFFSGRVGVKEQKAVTLLLRSGGDPGDLGDLRPAAAERPSSRSGLLFDFERSIVYETTSGDGRGGREDGAFRLRRVPGNQGAANLVLTMIPTLDARPFSALRFKVRGPQGTALLVHASDGYDEFDISRGPGRITHADPVALAPEWRVVSLPLDRMAVSLAYRPIPLNLALLRALMFDIGYPPREEARPPDEVWIDEVALVADDGTARLLADFDRPPEEVLFVSDGVATALARTFFRPQDIQSFPAERNTFVSALVLGGEFDASMVHRGQGAYRLHLPEPGDAGGLLTLGRGHGLEGAASIVFWARGSAGGERVRVEFHEPADGDLGVGPAAAPRGVQDGRLEDGWFELGTEWREYRVRLADYPDVDPRTLSGLRFRFGSDVGNPPGTTWFLDDIGYE